MLIFGLYARLCMFFFLSKRKKIHAVGSISLLGCIYVERYSKPKIDPRKLAAANESFARRVLMERRKYCLGRRSRAGLWI